ncbi:MAG: hypothetical protein AAF721_40205, partial [Myxococcota bacterium]
AYMPPEQLAGSPVDARSDQFSFCVALFEALHGRRPFEGDTIDTLRTAVEAGEIVGAVPANGPAWLRAAIRRGLSSDPGRRWPTLRDFLDVVRRRLQRRRLGAAVVVGAVAVSAGGLGLWLAAPPPICLPAEEELAGVWDDETRARLSSRLGGADLPHAAPTYATIERELDELSTDWSSTWDGACGRTDDFRSQLRELDCLRQSRQQLSFYVGGLGLMPVYTALDRPDLALSRMSDPRECAKPEIVRATPDPPGAAERTEVDGIRAALLASHAAPAATAEDLAALFEPIVARAETLTYPVLAEVLVLYASRLFVAEQPEVEVLRRAIDTAQRTRHDRVLAEARIVLLEATHRNGDVDAVQPALDAADSAVTRAGDPISLRARLLSVSAQVATVRRRWEEASRAAAALSSLYAGRYGEQDIRTLAARLVDFDNAHARSDAVAARALVEQALPQILPLIGEGHPGHAMLLIRLAQVEDQAGARQAARATSERAQSAMDLARRADGTLHPRAVTAIARLEIYRALAGLRCSDSVALVDRKLATLPDSEHGWLAGLGAAAAGGACFDRDAVLADRFVRAGFVAIEGGSTQSVSAEIDLRVAQVARATAVGDAATESEGNAWLSAAIAMAPGLAWSAEFASEWTQWQRGDWEEVWSRSRTRPEGDWTGGGGRAARLLAGVRDAHAGARAGHPVEAAAELAAVMPRLEACCYDTITYAWALGVQARLLATDRGDRADVEALLDRAESIIVAEDPPVAFPLTEVRAWRTELLGPAPDPDPLELDAVRVGDGGVEPVRTASPDVIEREGSG